MPKPRTIYGLNETAALLGMSLNTLKSKIEKGLPVITRGDRGTPWEIDVPDAVKWMVSNRPQVGRARTPEDGPSPTMPTGEFNLPEEQARERHHKANIAQMKEAEMSGDLIDRQSVRHACDAAAVIFRSGLENAAPRIAQKARSAKSKPEANTVVQAEVELILNATSEALTKAARTRSDSGVGDEDE